MCGTLDGFTGARSSTNLMPELALQWDSSEQATWYAKYSESAKSGGFAAALVVAADGIEYDDEESSSLELGRRSTLASGRGRFNFALFRTDFDDLQLNAFNPVTGAGFITNAASARSRGIELDGEWRVAENLTVRGAAAYLDARYRSFANAPCPISLILSGVEPPCDASGKTLPRAPRISASLGLDYRYPLAAGRRMVAGLSLGYTDEYSVDAALEPALFQDAYVSLAARVGLERADGRWAVALVGNNLTDEAILSDALPFLSNIGYLQSPRRIGLRVTYRLRPQ